MRHVISVIVENKPGVLTRISALFSRRGFNIESLTVGHTENPKLSRMTIVVEGDTDILEQIEKQLYKLIDTLKVIDLPKDTSVNRELVLIKVIADKKNRSEIIQFTDIYRGKIVDVGENTLTIEITGDDGKLEAFISMMSKFGIKELVRTGKIALHRGEKTVM
ncbi:acetolactate synthase small subunit [Hypnocyclicus thermotrophus]|uniref:Acetolactate synthase small subunit n=1 Tax=Hypnocyclicus thermotrophus TaxID=1627895 RepID=A0AA46I4S5_9FUSO|nr:acetolactate synthase small subunit [Hypnocyclicus thermotrophus]TDT67441.1 acetolactate synthase small subunit [Hypnocyclicus thermotrophus]